MANRTDSTPRPLGRAKHVARFCFHKKLDFTREGRLAVKFHRVQQQSVDAEDIRSCQFDCGMPFRGDRSEQPQRSAHQSCHPFSSVLQTIFSFALTLETSFHNMPIRRMISIAQVDGRDRCWARYRDARISHASRPCARNQHGRGRSPIAWILRASAGPAG
jgi:hypothetical protein